MRFLVLFIFLLALTACKSTLQKDDAPTPAGDAVQESRLEFSGCGSDSSVGGLVCYPGEHASIVTEFPGTVTVISTGDCNLREVMPATPPLTAIDFQSIPGKVCVVSAVYLPAYPTKPSQYPIGSLYGEILFDADNSFVKGGNFAIADVNEFQATFPGIDHGFYLSRQYPVAVRFAQTMVIKPKQIGTDVIRVSLTKTDGSKEFLVYTANYYSYTAVPVIYNVVEKNSQKWLQFPASVSLITQNGQVSGNQQVQILNTFDGYVRAYTVIGRTLVIRVKQGVILWTQ